jgi:hypothetical protein
MPMIEEITGQQSAMFSILRREQLDGDQLPQERRKGLEGGRIGQLGFNPSLARRATTPVGDIWVIPGNGWIALQDDGGAVATPTEVIASQGTMMWTDREGKGMVCGLVPDGVSEVTLFDHGNGSVNASVEDDVYGAMLTALFSSLRFTGSNGVIEQGPFS